MFFYWDNWPQNKYKPGHKTSKNFYWDLNQKRLRTTGLSKSDLFNTHNNNFASLKNLTGYYVDVYFKDYLKLTSSFGTVMYMFYSQQEMGTDGKVTFELKKMHSKVWNSSNLYPILIRKKLTNLWAFSEVKLGEIAPIELNMYKICTKYSPTWSRWHNEKSIRTHLN